MSFKEKTVVAILLLVARILCEDERLAKEIKSLSTHISVNAKEESEED